MKKLITLAVGAALSTSALADATTTVFGDVSQINKKEREIAIEAKHNNEKETGLQAHFKMENGLIIGAETKYDWTKGDKGFKESAIGAAYRFNINDNFYIMPQAIFTKQDSNNDIIVSGETFDMAGSFQQGNEVELAIQSGYHMDNGFFLVGRYGYSRSDDQMALAPVVPVPSSEVALNGIGYDGKVNSHKLDLTAGYEFSNIAVISATYTVERTGDDITLTAIDPIDPGFGIPGTDSVSGSGNQLQVKASYIGFDNIKPFVSYTAKGDYKFEGDSAVLNPALAELGKAENVVEVGVTVTF